MKLIDKMFLQTLAYYKPNIHSPHRCVLDWTIHQVLTYLPFGAGQVVYRRLVSYYS